jgi:hypothetical protein
MPTWIAGIRPAGMRQATSMQTWVPAIHAGTTTLRDCANAEIQTESLPGVMKAK